MIWAFAVILFVFLFLFWFSYSKNQRRLGFKVHVWKYRNPYSRQCIHCGRCESMYCYYGKYNQWEQICPAPHTPSACQHPKE